MKRTLLLIAAVMTICFTSCAQKTKTMSNSKTLVVYYSATGTTENVAKLIASVKGGVVYQIKPTKEYSAADLNWNDKSSRSTKEMADAKSRPAIVKDLKGIDNHDTIYIGFPIWWDEAPRVINTFIESYNLSGKTIIPFATSGGSSISNSEKVLKSTYPKLKWAKGKLLNRASKNDILKW
ncbi:MAG: flavodoxin [Prevotellaceae bacterium]|nr:flavodoxin [Prevotellaceae bacterium]